MKKERVFRVSIILVLAAIAIVIYLYKDPKVLEKDKVEEKKTVNVYKDSELWPALLNFGSNHCEPCQAMVPILNNIERKYDGKLNVEFVNVYSDKLRTLRYNIKIIPTQIFLDATGNVVYRNEGMLYEDNITLVLEGMGLK